jgi:hypothetical protein
MATTDHGPGLQLVPEVAGEMRVRLRGGLAEWLISQGLHDGDYHLVIKLRMQDGQPVAWTEPELSPRE